ncbi:MAG TPA: ribosomal protein S18-alanine N-acetyltransferase [Pyrinomonadaceae bacterium]|jgi:ribosomal-protein-alanine N-acetyltransferase|nr:ribosomal protein S18-alanine N-acetyltransferase [Pyrinomonadaceae bacterium]
MNDVTIRLMTDDDVTQCIKVADESSLSFWSEDAYHRELSRTDAIARVAANGTKVLGFIVGRIVAGPEAEIYNIGVRADARRAGIGRSLINSFTTECHKLNVNCIWLEVRISNLSAIKFYEEADFVQVSVRKGFYSNPSEDAVLMNKKI